MLDNMIATDDGDGSKAASIGGGGATMAPPIDPSRGDSISALLEDPSHCGCPHFLRRTSGAAAQLLFSRCALPLQWCMLKYFGGEY